MPYAVLNLENNQYEGWRMVAEGWSLETNETLVYSLDGLSEKTPLLGIEEKRQILVEQFKALPIGTRVAFQTVAVTVDTALKLGDVELALFNLEQAKLMEGADITLLQSMIDLITGGQANG